MTVLTLSFFLLWEISRRVGGRPGPVGGHRWP